MLTTPLPIRQGKLFCPQLRQHQIQPTFNLTEILLQYQSAIDWSDCGVGKTYVAQAVAKALGLPTLVVCPKIAVTSWRTAGEVLGNEVDAIGYEKLRTGRTPFGWWDNPLIETEDREYLRCTHCQQKVTTQACYCHPAGIHCVEVKKKDWNYGKFNFHPGVKLAIFDEVHRCGALDSLNADMLLATKRQGIKVLGLSATAACSPLNMRALGYILDLHNDKSDLLGPFPKHCFFSWARRYGCRKDPKFHGFKWFASEAQQKEIMAQIRASVVPSRGVRVSTKDIPGFPACQIEAELYDIEEADKINQIYEQMAEALAVLEEKKLADKCADNPLTIVLRACQEIELLKVPIMVELTRDYVAKGYNVACFINYKQTMAELKLRLNTSCCVDGDTIGKYRDASIALFQLNKENVILVNTAAGGACISLQDLHGRPRVGLGMPVQSANIFRQYVGRLPREGGLSPALYRILFAANTYEVKLHRALRAKLNCLDALNDGDLNPANLTFA